MMRRAPCPHCGAEVIIAKDGDGHRVVLDASTPVYFEARLNERSGNPVVARHANAFALHATICGARARFAEMRDASRKTV